MRTNPIVTRMPLLYRHTTVPGPERWNGLNKEDWFGFLDWTRGFTLGFWQSIKLALTRFTMTGESQ